jgi:hypothetical protein
VVDTHADGRGIDTLDVAVENVLDVVEIVVLSADCVVVGIKHGHPFAPSIVFAHSENDIAVGVVDHLLEVFGADADVGLGIVAAGVGRAIGALLTGDLHHANLASAASNVGPASTLLKGDGSEENGRNAGLAGHVLKDREIVLAGSEDIAVLLEYGGKILVDHVLEGDRGWLPALVTVDAAVKPV